VTCETGVIEDNLTTGSETFLLARGIGVQDVFFTG